MSTDTREERLARRIADLYANDRQFADARPSEAITAAIDQPGLRLPQIVRTVMEGYAERPALGQRAIRFVNDPQTGRTSVDLLPRFETTSYRELWDRVGAVATALSRRAIAVGAARRSGLCAGLHQRRLHDHRRGVGPDGRGMRSATDQRAGDPAAAHRGRDRAERDRRERRLSGRCRRTGADRARARAAGRLRLPPRGGRPARDVRRRPVAVGASGQPGECGNAGRRARPREGAAGRTGVRRRRGRPVDAADLHLRQHRRTEGRHATRAPGRQLLAQTRGVGPAAQRRTVDHAQLHADEPLDGAGQPVRDARQWRHGLFRSQERSLDFPGRPRAGAAHAVGLRAADLGHAVRRVPERTGPAVVRSASIARHWKHR